MGIEITFSEDAENDLFEIYYYIAMNDSSGNAEKVKNKIINAAKKLSTLPNRGHSVKILLDTYPEVLEIIINPYRIMYEISKNDVIILAILDSRRDLTELLQERFLR